MTSIILTIFLEGDRDSILFHHKIKHYIEDHDIKVEIIEYSQKDKKFINSYIDLINRNRTTKKYYFLVDLDNCHSITDKKNELMEIYNRLEESRIIVVCKEIEGWYLGGLSQISAQNLQIDLQKFNSLDPNTVTKSQFQRLKPKQINKLRVFYIFSAKLFDQIVAKERNLSFSSFHSRLFPLN
jgi:hypothetical protein